MTEEKYTPEELDFIAIEDETTLEANDLQAVAIQIEKITDRQRQITAKIQIPQPVTQVWEVLTNYEALAEFIPNLAQSRLLEHPNGGIRLEQIGSQRFLRMNFSARVVLDLEERFPKKITFQMIEGDFKDFSGSWCLEPCSLGQQIGTNLCYTVKVWPKLTMPVGIIERRLAKDLQLNLLAIYQRLENSKK
ncbi:cyclase [Mastigocladus laminosus UU774]|nr:cyclase [Mastigocladus laminosus UU774]